MLNHFKRLLPLSLLLLLAWGMAVPEAIAAKSCQGAYSGSAVKENRFHERGYKEAALEIMMEGSLSLSRTKSTGRRFMAPDSVTDEQISKIAEVNFRRAARFILENFENLEMNLQTAVTINKILTKELVPEEVRGRFDYRAYGDSPEIDKNIGQLPKDFYVTWLSSPAAKLMFKTSPVEFAEVVHNTVVALDSFTDGNGRLSRLLADLALIKSGLAPADYTSMQDYFDRGNTRSGVAREVRKQYFKEVVRRGQLRLRFSLNLFLNSQRYVEVGYLCSSAVT